MKVDKCCEMLTILIMQSDDSYFLKANQYTLACAVVAASRRHCKITLPSLWPEELVELTGLNYGHFAPIEEKLN
jgi:hypothetical protein